MARMPRGEPRSVPDPDREPYAAMIRQEQLRRQLAESAAGNRPSLFGSGPLLPAQRRYDFSTQAGRFNPYIEIGNQFYKGEDNGRANVLVPVDDPRVPPGEMAERRRAVARVRFMADHPLGSAGYSLATLANASPGARDGALFAGGLADTLMSGVAPFGGSIRSPTKPPRGRVAQPNLPRPSVEYRAANAIGQAQGANATLSKQTLGTGTRAKQSLVPPGWQGDGKFFNEARGHLVGKQLGGPGATLDQVVTQTQNGSNTPQMSKFESGLARRLRNGEVINYFVTPLYSKGFLPPSSLRLMAHGSRDMIPSVTFIKNPAGNPKK